MKFFFVVQGPDLLAKIEYGRISILSITYKNLGIPFSTGWWLLPIYLRFLSDKFLLFLFLRTPMIAGIECYFCRAVNRVVESWSTMKMSSPRQAGTSPRLWRAKGCDVDVGYAMRDVWWCQGFHQNPRYSFRYKFDAEFWWSEDRMMNY